MSTKHVKVGVIGAGNMANAIVKGMIRGGHSAQDIYIYDIEKRKLDTLSQETRIVTLDNNKDVVKSADIVILAVKPQVYPAVLDQIRDCITEEHIIISIAAGISTDYIRREIGADRRINVVRIMPNTPALIGKGVIAICKNEQIEHEKFEGLIQLFSALGQIEIVDEENINAVTGISGSGPAYVFMFIEALADGGVMMGLPRDQAYRMAAQTLRGSAAMYMDTKIHPGALKDMVCSPAGTTIEAVYALEKEGFRAAIMEAVKECAKKGEDLSK